MQKFNVSFRLRPGKAIVEKDLTQAEIDILKANPDLAEILTVSPVELTPESPNWENNVEAFLAESGRLFNQE